MNDYDSQVFNQAVQLANAGRNQEAYQTLKSIEANNRTDSNLILWLIFTTPDPNEAQYQLTRLAILDPENPNLEIAREWVSK